MNYSLEDLLDLAIFDSRNMEDAKKIIEAGADVNKRDHLGLTLLHKAIEKQMPEFVDFLIEQGADVNKASMFAQKPGPTPLNYAAATGQFEIWQKLRDSGAHNFDQDLYVNDMNMLLMSEISKGNFEHYDGLITSGADWNVLSYVDRVKYYFYKLQKIHQDHLDRIHQRMEEEGFENLMGDLHDYADLEV